MSKWKALLPRVIKAREVNAAPPGSPQRAVEWWAGDHYVTHESLRGLRWLGKTWVTWRYRKFPDAYLAPADDLVGVVEQLTAAGILPSLTRESRVFESGCNLGRNLLALRRRFGCSVTGMDVSPHAVKQAANEIWRGQERTLFLLDDVLTTKWFASIPDGHFDLVLVRWHLLHIPPSPQKRAYVAQLKRIGKTFLVLEPASPEEMGTVQWEFDGKICLAVEDWGKEYELTEIIADPPIENTRVFYSRPSARSVSAEGAHSVPAHS